MVKIGNMEIDENALVLAVNYYPPETGARIKEAQESSPEDAQAMRQAFAASVDEPYTTAYLSQVSEAGNSRGLDVIDLSSGQMLIIGDSDNILDARNELASTYHTSIYTPAQLKEKLEGKQAPKTEAKKADRGVLVVSIFNSEDHAMLQALNDAEGVSLADLHALRQRAGEKFGGLPALNKKIGDVAVAHNLGYDPNLPLEDEIALIGKQADIEAAATEFTELGLENSSFGVDEYREYLKKIATGAMNIKIDEDDDDFDGEAGPRGGGAGGLH